ncbi:Lrp/AsnC family transcriptional regulator [Paracoccus marinaquae]|uniref:Lrp/AsnC family transcriptional regulator n=1 Tax=Paracoccus marinaquae TaxID=2841926 RepID=A0ABS6AIL5_9RHOB|nr:Lrp/AsnC family transcriptional regulator [Paracoccus marinaquae]MBU3029469.1 Lrp/AsnC family transcriptional regulator [Paracoccus marinaquae]
MPIQDDADRRILATLRQDSRISNADLAERVGLSASSCWRRVRALEERGAIRRYTVDLDEAALGLGFRAIVHVHLTRHDQALVREFIRQIRTKDEVRACYATTGASDYHLHVLCPDLDAYNRFLEDFLFSIPAVASAQTNLVLRTIKD